LWGQAAEAAATAATTAATAATEPTVWSQLNAQGSEKNRTATQQNSSRSNSSSNKKPPCELRFGLVVVPVPSQTAETAQLLAAVSLGGMSTCRH